MKRTVTAAALLLGTALAFSSVWGVGLSVEPGGLLIQGVPVGRTSSVEESSGIRFVIYNRDDIEHTYTVSANRPSQVANGKWPRGYGEIPDVSWVKPVPEVLRIPPGGSASFDVILEIPEDPNLYNRKWATTLSVQGSPGPGRNVALALYPMLQIETESAVPERFAPREVLTVAPATLTVEDEGAASISFQIFNGDTQPHSYRIGVSKPGGKIPPTPGHTPAADLFVPKLDSVRVDPLESKDVTLEINADGASCDPGLWEQLIFVEAETGECTFLRLQIVKERPAPRCARRDGP